MTTDLKRQWWKEAVVYQVYPRSFQDSDADGIGDLNGITQRLDYIQSLGIDVIWLNPVYPSPNDDNGYDISDYRNILSDFGTMDDFDRLLAGVKQRGMKLIMDLVANHSSDEHFWFQESRKSRDNPYRDYYHWWPAENGVPPKRWSYFDLESNAWKYDEQTDAYYLHCFSVKQPDLKWENKKVRQEIYDIIRYWFEKGVDGFRMDVISFISKDITYPELPEEYHGDFVPFYANGPRLHEFLKEMNEEVLQHYEVMTVGEAPGVSKEQALNFVDEDRKELNMFFHFDLMSLDRDEEEFFKRRKNSWKLKEFKTLFSEWDAVFAKKGWGSLFLDNHDFPRAVSRWGNDSPEHWYASATMLQTFILTMRGTPYFYYGEEIGMTNVKFDNIEDYRDINTINRFQTMEQSPENIRSFIENEKHTARDNARTPMQWDETEHAGFTNGEPWIAVNKNYKYGLNVAAQELHKESVLHYFRKMVAIRKSNLGLIYGLYDLIWEDHEHVYAYTRKLEEEAYLVILSFSAEPQRVLLSEEISSSGKLLISNDHSALSRIENNMELQLKPYQAVVYKLD
ncbi:glycoside hydrolase family 13 protein [Poritiphilus flavus]|uniref:Alpha,alpha-phosphotrehalase n=1 Tax=Poritiphilus flavus TaxID=2697053 RepID=A0A6L9EBW1_9FLAO|nr:alpha-glucosidase [Poritiphilus flavus]NAS12061.1 alpha,alpha-phosphotrehalase [Poritiphilus flavus]